MRPAQGWTTDRMPRLDGTRAVVTGATNGVGLETARALAAAGAHVVLAVRDTTRGEQRRREIGGSTDVRKLDLSDLASVRAFAADLDGDLDLLVNNAGMFPLRQERTDDGVEIAMATNALGPYALTELLLPQVGGRIVNVTSHAHKAARLDPADPQLRRGWSAPRAYAGSKLVIMGWTLDLARRLQEKGSPVRVLACDPGWAASNLSNKPGLGALHRLAQGAAHLAGHDNATAARSTLAAAVDDLPSGSYVGFDGVAGLRGAVALVGRSARASDPRFAAWAAAFARGETGVG